MGIDAPPYRQPGRCTTCGVAVGRGERSCRPCASANVERRRAARVVLAVRMAVYERDGMRCRYCGVEVVRSYPYTLPNEATVDHVVPVLLGGTNAIDNLVTACRRCNARKSYSRWTVPTAPTT